MRAATAVLCQAVRNVVAHCAEGVGCYGGGMSTRHIPAQIGDLPPIGRPANSALLVEGITTLDEVAAFGRKRLLALHGVGPKAVRILSEALDERGIAFSD